MPPPFSRSSLYAALRVAGYVPDQRVEFSAIGKRGAIQTRWVRVDHKGLEKAARWLNAREGKKNLYVLANPLRQDAKRARASSRAEDVQCASRELLLLDVDPAKVRRRDLDRGKFPEGTPLDETGTRPEKLQAAVEVADELRAFIEERLCVRPPLVSSGRGRQVWLRIAGHHSDAVRKQLVQGLAARFDRPGLADLDRATHNVARLMRLPGSTNLRTGDRAAVLDPGDGQLASAEAVAALAEELLPTPDPAQRKVSKAPEGGARGEASPWTEAIRAACNVHRCLDLLGLPPMPPKGNTCCPIHGGDSPSGFSVSPDGQLWKCWTGGCLPRAGQTHAAGDVIELVARVRQLERLEARRWLAEQVGVERQEQEDDQLPLAEVYEPPREATSEEGLLEIVRSVLRGPKGRAGLVAQDRRPTGSGKTYGTAREVAQAAAEKDGTYLWAAPNHNHARLDVLPAFCADDLPVAIWDEDLDGEGTDASPGVREKLLAGGAKIVDVGVRPTPFTATVCKVPRFACPGPEVPGWTSESVAEAYVDAASRGWNPAATVCRACPRFVASGDDFCSYWERRREVAQADVLIVPHHALKPGSGATSGRRGVVVDEDPSGALVKRHRADRRGLAAFRALLEAAIELIGAEATKAGEELEQKRRPLPIAGGSPQVAMWDEQEPHQREGGVEQTLDEIKAQAKAEARDEAYAKADDEAQTVVYALRELDRMVAGWEADREAKVSVLDAYALERPADLDAEALAEPDSLQSACERVLRDLGRRNERLVDREGRPVGAVRNLFPFLGALARAWRDGEPAVIHVGKGRGRQPIAAVLPVVEPLPDLPVLALDATGDPRLLELASKREVQLIEGHLRGKLTGVHLADVPCGRRRWSDEDRLGRDVDVIVRHCKRMGAKRIGLVTFKAHVQRVASELARRLGAEVRTLHYGAERGSNAFAGWADVMVLAGTPFVTPAELRLRASLEGASVEELLTAPEWQRRRLPGGGKAQAMVFPGDATAQAYTALVRAALEQALGRALRGDYVPEHGVLVLAEPWPTRHRLRVSTRDREALDGPGAEAADLLDEQAEGVAAVAETLPRMQQGLTDAAELAQVVRREAARLGAGAAGLTVAALRQQARGGEGPSPAEILHAFVGGLVAAAGGATRVAEMMDVSARAVRLWVGGNTLPELDRLALLLNSSEVETPPVSTSRVFPPRGVSTPEAIRGVFPPRGGNTQDRSQVVTVHSEERLLGKALCGVFPGAEPTQHVFGNTPFRKRVHLIVIDGGASGMGVSTFPEVLSQSPSVSTPLCETCVAVRAVEVCGGQRALARRLSVSHAAAAHWQHGRREPDAATLAALAEIAGVELPEEQRPAYREVKAGDAPPGVGMVYGPARLPVETPPEASREARHCVPKKKRDPRSEEQEVRLPVAPADDPTVADLRAWADPTKHPAWLCRAAHKAKGLGSLATWFGSVRRGGKVEIDQDLALQRAQELADLRKGAPVQVRRLLGKLSRLLAKRGAKMPTNSQGRASQRRANVGLANDPVVQLAKRELDASRVKR